MHRSDPTLGPNRKMEVGDVAEPDQWLRAMQERSEIQPIRNAVGARAAPGGDDGADAAVSKRIVEVFKSVIIATRHGAPDVQSMATDLHPEPPALQLANRRLHQFATWLARRRHDSNPIAVSHHGRQNR